jgi:hypothetical protein
VCGGGTAARGIRGGVPAGHREVERVVLVCHVGGEAEAAVRVEQSEGGGAERVGRVLLHPRESRGLHHLRCLCRARPRGSMSDSSKLGGSAGYK